MIDTHAHLTNERFAPDLDALLDAEPTLEAVLTIGTGIADGERALTLARRLPHRVWWSVGLDPYSAHELGEGFADGLTALERLAAEPDCRAVGEFGIECHHDLAPLPAQREQAAAQLALARRLDKPVVLHARRGKHGDAHAHMLDLLAACPGTRGVIHSFDGDAALARRYLDAGLHIAINGMVTYKANGHLRSAVATVPEDRLLVETDAPYLSPEPNRGRRNHPGWVRLVIAACAVARNVEPGQVERITASNARALFHG